MPDQGDSGTAHFQKQPFGNLLFYLERYGEQIKIKPPLLLYINKIALSDKAPKYKESNVQNHIETKCVFTKVVIYVT